MDLVTHFRTGACVVLATVGTYWVGGFLGGAPSNAGPNVPVQFDTPTRRRELVPEGPIRTDNPLRPSAVSAQNQRAEFDPLRVPECANVDLRIVTQSLVSPLDSVAWVRTEEGRRDVRTGSDLDAWHVAFIGYNDLRMTPAIWLTDGRGSVCQKPLFWQTRMVPAAQPPRPERPAAAWNDQVQRIGEEVIVSRNFLYEVLDDPYRFLGSLRIVPVKDKGRTAAIRLFGIKDATLLRTLGFENGDALYTINGQSVSDPAALLRLFPSVSTVSELRAHVVRRGRSELIDVKLR